MNGVVRDGTSVEFTIYCCYTGCDAKIVYPPDKTDIAASLINAGWFVQVSSEGYLNDVKCWEHLPASMHPKDVVNHPSHYTSGSIEVWDFIVDQDLDYLRGNVIKYVSRAGKKDPLKELEDLNKARAYLNKAIEELEKGKS